MIKRKGRLIKKHRQPSRLLYSLSITNVKILHPRLQGKHFLRIINQNNKKCWESQIFGREMDSPWKIDVDDLDLLAILVTDAVADTSQQMKQVAGEVLIDEPGQYKMAMFSQKNPHTKICQLQYILSPIAQQMKIQKNESVYEAEKGKENSSTSTIVETSPKARLGKNDSHELEMINKELGSFLKKKAEERKSFDKYLNFTNKHLQLLISKRKKSIYQSPGINEEGIGQISHQNDRSHGEQQQNNKKPQKRNQTQVSNHQSYSPARPSKTGCIYHQQKRNSTEPRKRVGKIVHLTLPNIVNRTTSVQPLPQRKRSIQSTKLLESSVVNLPQSISGKSISLEIVSISVWMNEPNFMSRFVKISVGERQPWITQTKKQMRSHFWEGHEFLFTNVSSISQFCIELFQIDEEQRSLLVGSCLIVSNRLSQTCPMTYSDHFLGIDGQQTGHFTLNYQIIKNKNQLQNGGDVKKEPSPSYKSSQSNPIIANKTSKNRTATERNKMREQSFQMRSSKDPKSIKSERIKKQLPAAKITFQSATINTAKLSKVSP